MSVPAQQKEARAGGTGRGLGWAWGPLPTPQSGQVATSAAPVSSLPDTENSNLSGDKGLGWFLSSSSWKGINWHRSCVHVPSYIQHVTQRRACTRQASRASGPPTWSGQLGRKGAARGLGHVHSQPTGLQEMPPSSFQAQECHLPTSLVWQCTLVHVTRNKDGFYPIVKGLNRS